MRRACFLGMLLAVLTGCDRVEPYQACSNELACGSSAPLCLASTTGTGHTALFCTRRCTTPAASASECPGTAACVALSPGNPVCMKVCAAVADCDFDNAACLVLPESHGARVCTTAP